MVLVYLMVFWYLLLPPERQTLLRVDLALSIDFQFGLSSVVINIALPEWVFQEIFILTKSHEFVKATMKVDQSLQ